MGVVVSMWYEKVNHPFIVPHVPVPFYAPSIFINHTITEGPLFIPVSYARPVERPQIIVSFSGPHCTSLLVRSSFPGDLALDGAFKGT